MSTTAKKTRSPKKPVVKKALSKQEKAELKKIIDAAYGSLAWVDYSVDDYLREKRAEVERESNS